MRLGTTTAVDATVTLKSPVSLVLSALTVSVGVCVPVATLESPALPVTGEPSVSGRLLKFHWKVKGPLPVTLQERVKVPPTEPNWLTGWVIKPSPASGLTEMKKFVPLRAPLPPALVTAQK